ncbi:MAG TPA: TonB-dependent receptor plug domain-containing protein, partial [Methylococcaceae bacterium]|nr:TonB-dependent receptor plug domain-containing protein [Methylococcaceae bacterium]
IPDLLRFVPGAQVAQMNGSQWAVGVRGLAGIYSNKLQVMIDGRSIFNPVFSGVHWDHYGLMLEDIERIEVIRGPGATQWGSNAVNGVINIITRTARNSQGLLASGGGGNVQTGFGAARYGGKLGEDAWYKVYAKHSTQDNFEEVTPPSALGDRPRFTGKEAHDRWKDDRGGFRLDWDASSADSLTFQGDFFQGASDRRTALPVFPSGFEDEKITMDNSGETLAGRWSHAFSPDLRWETKSYWDHYRKVNHTWYREEVQTLDLDSQITWRWNERHEIVAGAGYRYVSDDLSDHIGDILYFTPGKRKTSTYNIFIQDDFALIPDTLDFIYGVKYEYNGFAGSQAQPNGRLLWKISNAHRLWGAVSHATRTPVRLDQDFNLNFQRFTNPAPNLFCPGGAGVSCQFALTSNPDQGSEKLDAFELGYRFTPYSDFSLDLAGFYNRYYDLRTFENRGFQLRPGEPFIQNIFQRANLSRAETLGVEATANWQVAPRWKLSANYSHIRQFAHLDAKSNDTRKEPHVEIQDPENMISLRSQLNLPGAVELDGTLYYVDDSPFEAINMPGMHAQSYFRVDTRLGWSPAPGLQLDLIGQNLLDNRHLEFVDDFTNMPSEVPRSVFARVTWQFN